MIYFVGSTKTVSIDDVIDWLKTKKIISIDTETTGLDCYSSSLIMLQVGDYNDQFVIDVRSIDISPLKKYLESNDILKIGHNLKFDYKFLKLNNITLCNIYDTMLAELIINCGLNVDVGLDSVVSRYLGVDMSKSTRETFVDFDDSEFTEEQINYGSQDIRYLEKVYEKQSKKLSELNLASTLNLEVKFLPILAEIELNGIKLDVNKWLVINKKNKEKLLTLTEKLNDYILSNPSLSEFTDAQLELFNDKLTCNINWNSPKQIIKLFNKLGINTAFLKDGVEKNSVQAKNIQKYREKFEIVDLYLQYKEMQKMVSTYGENFLKYVNPVTNRIHSDYWQIVTTSRLSSSAPNLQNIPRDNDIRSCFIASSNNVLITADFSQIEPRVTADKSQDPVLINFFNEGGGDIYNLVASRMYSIIEAKPVTVTKADVEKRQVGKTLSLKLDYGGTAYTVKDELKVSQDEAQKFIDVYFASFPEKKKYFDNKAKETILKGYVLTNTITNRKIFIPFYDEFISLKNKPYDSFTQEERRAYGKMRGMINRMSYNFPIQSSAGDILKLACIYAVRNFVRANLKVRIINLIHDEILIECNPDIAVKVAEICRISMIDAGKVFCKTVPMSIVPKIAKQWVK